MMSVDRRNRKRSESVKPKLLIAERKPPPKPDAQLSTSRQLRHYGKRKIVAIATFVTRLQVIAADCYYRAIGEIGKGPGDRCGRGVADDGEGGSYAESDTGFSVNS